MAVTINIEENVPVNKKQIGASGKNSTTFGKETSSRGNQSIAMGDLTVASGENSFAGGESSIVPPARVGAIHPISDMCTGDTTLYTSSLDDPNYEKYDYQTELSVVALGDKLIRFTPYNQDGFYEIIDFTEGEEPSFQVFYNGPDVPGANNQLFRQTTYKIDDDSFIFVGYGDQGGSMSHISKYTLSTNMWELTNFTVPRNVPGTVIAGFLYYSDTEYIKKVNVTTGVTTTVYTRPVDSYIYDLTLCYDTIDNKYLIVSHGKADEHLFRILDVTSSETQLVQTATVSMENSDAGHTTIFDTMISPASTSPGSTRNDYAFLGKITDRYSSGGSGSWSHMYINDSFELIVNSMYDFGLWENSEISLSDLTEENPSDLIDGARGLFGGIVFKDSSLWYSTDDELFSYTWQKYPTEFLSLISAGKNSKALGKGVVAVGENSTCYGEVTKTNLPFNGEMYSENENVS